MSNFRDARVTSFPDPYKRVHYALGMVLGVDEFEQEQAYFLEGKRRHNRTLHGYGTVCGLEVTRDGTQIRVGAGLALTPNGSEVRVPRAQCARLDEWLEDPEVRNHLMESAEPPGTFSTYVTLCYTECETDAVPIPGTPCRSEDESIAPSRITESFELQFALSPPEQVEEDAIRAFGRLMRRLVVTSDPLEEGIGPEEMADAVRALLDEVGVETPEAAEEIEASEDAEAPLFVRPEAVEAIIDTALKVWVTEVRPALLSDDAHCACGPPGQECILLARIDFDVDANWVIDVESIRVVDDERPYLVQTRLITELLRHRSEGVTDHGRLSGLEDDDHPQYLKVDETSRALIEDLDAAGNKVINLSPAENDGDAVPYEQAIKDGQAAGGDLQGTYPDPVVARLGGEPFTPNPSKQSGWVATWTGSTWTARPVPPPPQSGTNLEAVARDLPTAPFVTITRVPRGTSLRLSRPIFLPTFELWFHLNVAHPSEANLYELVSEKLRINVFGETDRSTPQASPYLTPIEVIDMSPKPGTRNVVRVILAPTVDNYEYLRFYFRLDEMLLRSESGDELILADWVEKRPIKWLGHDGDRSVTTFYQNDVRQKPIASGMIDPQGNIVGENLRILAFDIKNSRIVVTWQGYDPMKQTQTLIVAHAQEVPGRGEGWPVFVQVTEWNKEGVVLIVRSLQGNYPLDVVITTIQVIEIL